MDILNTCILIIGFLFIITVVLGMFAVTAMMFIDMIKEEKGLLLLFTILSGVFIAMFILLVSVKFICLFF